MRKSSEYYRQVINAASSPSELSFRSITEFYQLPDEKFKNPDEVYLSRGYKKINKIDEGAFGVVSKAQRLSDRKLVAVKEIDLRKRRAKRVEEMKRELFVLERVNSDYVVKLYEHFIVNQTLVIVMEYCAGSNLTAYLKEVAMEEKDALAFFRQMAKAIRVLHKKSIGHRDVKLNNFLLDATRNCVKIADFGLSIVAYKKSQGVLLAKTYCGTEPYMAPELLKRNRVGARQYNPLCSDIWSLGVCLYAMLTRTFPFKLQANQQEQLQAQVARKWRFPRALRSTLSDEVKDLVFHMLDPEPARRITINGVITHPWLNQNKPITLSLTKAEPESVPRKQFKDPKDKPTITAPIGGMARGNISHGAEKDSSERSPRPKDKKSKRLSQFALV